MAAVMVSGSTVGAVCALAAPRPLRPMAVALSVLTALAGADLLIAVLTMSGLLVQAPVWASVLVLAAVAAAGGMRLAGRHGESHRAMTVHRSIGTIVMAASVFTATGSTGPATAAHGHGAVHLGLLVIVASLGLAVLAVPAVRSAPQGRNRLAAAVECAAMTASCAVMALHTL
jgi:hypothetical protein